MRGFDVERARELLSRRGVPATVEWCETTTSTNDDAACAAREGAPHLSVYGADAQAAGRGRRGRTWQSAPGENLTCSIVVRAGLPPARTAPLTLAVGLAVRRAVADRVEQAALVKWPNDVLVSGRKLAGILLESTFDGSPNPVVIAGVGINVAMRDVPRELAETATSLALLGSERLSREELLADLLAEIAPRVRLLAEGGAAALSDELNRVDALRDQRIRIGSVEGVARGIAADGALRIERADGTITRVVSGTVERLGD